MNKYVALLSIGTITQMSEQESEALVKQHVENLRKWKADGVLVMCGLLGNSGAMLILNAGSSKDAENCLLSDQLIRDNYTLVIHEFIEANEGNNYLL